MTSTYEQRLATYDDWPHSKPSAEDMAAAGLIRQPCTKDLTSCPECLMAFADWSVDSDPLQIHLEKNGCSLAQALAEEAAAMKAKEATAVTRKTVEPEALIAAKPKLKQGSKIKELDELDAKGASPTAQETADQEAVIASPKPRSKAKPSKPSESIKSEDFTISPSSAPAKSCSKPITRLDEILKLNPAIAVAMTSLCLNEPDADEAAAAARKAMKQETAAAAAAIEAIKPEACAEDIEFFDPTMLLNLPEFHISASSASFLHHLAEVAVNYQGKSVMKILPQCLRGPALTWFKGQPKFTSLNDFKTVIAKAFPSSPAEPAANPDSVIIDPSPQYHTCLECAAQFSSTSRLLVHVQKGCSKTFTCKHCEEAFTSNNKLHEHVRLHNKTLGQRFAEGGSSHIDLPITPPITPRISEEAIATSPKVAAKPSRLPRPVSACITPSANPSITSAASTASAAPKSRHHRPTSMPPTPPPSPPQTPIHKHHQHQEQHRKPHLTVNSLFEMFAEKPSGKSRNIIQKDLSSLRFPEPRSDPSKLADQPDLKDSNPDTSHRPHLAACSGLAHDHKPATSALSISSPKFMRQLNIAPPTPPNSPPTTSRSTSAMPAHSHQPITMAKAPVTCPPSSPPIPLQSPKTYMTMKDLFAMFAGKEKRFRKSLGTIHKRMRSPCSSTPGQAQITSYFKPASQPSNALKSNAFTSYPCPAPRACFPANRITGTPQYQVMATGETSNQRPKPSKVQSPCTSQQEYMAAAGVDHTDIGIRVGTPLTNAGGYEMVKSSKSLNSEAFTSRLSSALRPYLLANSKPIVLHVSASIWPLTKQ